MAAWAGRIKAMLIQLLDLLLMVAVAVLVLDVLWGVFTRYALGEQAKWTEELARFILIWVTMLGGALAFGHHSHLGVDVLVNRFDAATRKAMALFAHAMVLCFALIIFLYGGGRVVVEALRLEQTTPALGWQMGYVYLALPLSGLFMILFTVDQVISLLSSSASTASGQAPSGDDDHTEIRI